MIMAPVVKLEVFQGQWGTLYAQQHCYMCKGRLYHTVKEHDLILEETTR